MSQDFVALNASHALQVPLSVLKRIIATPEVASEADSARSTVLLLVYWAFASMMIEPSGATLSIQTVLVLDASGFPALSIDLYTTFHLPSLLILKGALYTDQITGPVSVSLT
jgi:hypothetical protein